MLFKKAGPNILDLNTDAEGFIFVYLGKLFDFLENQFPHFKDDASHMYLEVLFQGL